MLKTASDFENSMNYIIKDQGRDMTKDIMYQSPIMNSSSFNSTMDSISKELDMLYEKTRVLSDVLDYAEEFVKTNVYTKKAECDAILKSVEYNRDKLRATSYVFYDINLLPGAGSYTDRDGSQLPKADIYNNSIVLSGDVVSRVAVKGYTRIATEQSYLPATESLADLINGNPYRVTYSLDMPAKGGIYETIKCSFNSESTINDFDVIASNCNVVSIEYIDNDTAIIDANTGSSIKKQMKITDANIIINCSNYQIVDDKYVYNFGIDSISATVKNINSVCCHVSQDIDLGAVDENTFVQLSADYRTDMQELNSSVEFYIVDGGKEYPIVPIEDSAISNEKIFYGLDTRFAVNNTKAITVMKDGNIITNVDVNQLPGLNDGNYAVSYTPTESHSYYASGNVIKIKTIIRSYDTLGNAPYVNKLEIRKFGGDTLWVTQ